LPLPTCGVKYGVRPSEKFLFVAAVISDGLTLGIADEKRRLFKASITGALASALSATVPPRRCSDLIRTLLRRLPPGKTTRPLPHQAAAIPNKKENR